MHHAKTIVADDRFAGIGTMNFDNRSMAFNDESVFVAYDEELTPGWRRCSRRTSSTPTR